MEAVLEPIGSERLYVGSPPLVPVKICQQKIVELRQFQEVMLCGLYFGNTVTVDATRGYQVPCFEGLAAGVALVAPDVLHTAYRTYPLDIPVREEPCAASAVILHAVLLAKMPFLKKSKEEILHSLYVILRVGLREEREFDAHILDGFLIDPVVPVGDLFRTGSFLLRSYRYWCAVLVRPRDH